ncbi:MAG: hypothetical protein UX37_C0018G0004 [Microgenomates group bacterium GW2011_GWA2_46_16]|nr:MAG: hypothetical protein UX37_C0018G0004 [Microgenomates group bacterium GW2011_GWA2_46_16]
MDQFKFLQAVNRALRNLGTNRLISGLAPYVSITRIDRGSIHERLCIAKFVFEGDSPVRDTPHSKVVSTNREIFDWLEFSPILRSNRRAMKIGYGAKFPTTGVSGDEVIIVVSGTDSPTTMRMVNFLAQELIDAKQIVNITPM